jgi:hypothetical protein
MLGLSEGERDEGAMWQFNWGVFWAISPVLLLIFWISNQIEALNRCLLDIEKVETELKAIHRDLHDQDASGVSNLARHFSQVHQELRRVAEILETLRSSANRDATNGK